MRRPLWLAPFALWLIGCGAAPVRPARAADSPARSPPEDPSGCTTAPVTYYDDALAGRRTASGERYDPSALTAAHRSLPFGTWLRVGWRGHEVRVRVNDRGGPRRGVDLSRAAAERLQMIRAGRIEATVCGG